MKESITDLMAQYHGQLTDLAERLQTELTDSTKNGLLLHATYTTCYIYTHYRCSGIYCPNMSTGVLY